MLIRLIAIGCLASMIVVQPLNAGPSDAPSASKIVIAHRGASGYLPEHTLEAYALAYGMGADFIEPDVVMTQDKVLIALHDITLDTTTDVKTRYPNRMRADQRFYAADFTLKEIKTLSAKERRNDRYQVNSQGFQIPTLIEVIELIQNLNRLTGCGVGLYPETKNPKFHDQEKLPLESTLLKVLADHGYSQASDPIFIQSFDPDNLKEMRFQLNTQLPLIQLIGGDSLFDPLLLDSGLDDIKRYAQGIGPSKTRLVNSQGQDSGLVKRAHERGLLVHPYTFRADQLPAGFKTFNQELMLVYQQLDVDGVFTDHPDQVRQALASVRQCQP